MKRCIQIINNKHLFQFFMGWHQELDALQCQICKLVTVWRSDRRWDGQVEIPNECPDCHGDIVWLSAKKGKLL